MSTFQERSEYRKNLNSPGQIHLGGEILEIKSYDVSVKGIMVEIFPGKILSSLDDIQASIDSNEIVEIFVEELKLTGESKIVWVKQENEKIMMGLEFKDVQYNSQKLWMKRMAYRQQKSFDCSILMENNEIPAQGINISIGGLAITGDLKTCSLNDGDVVNLQLKGVAVYQALGKVMWQKENLDGSITMGLRYMELG